MPSEQVTICLTIRIHPFCVMTIDRRAAECGLAIITVDEDGRSHVDTPSRVVGASAAGGALCLGRWG